MDVFAGDSGDAEFVRCALGSQPCSRDGRRAAGAGGRRCRRTHDCRLHGRVDDTRTGACPVRAASANPAPAPWRIVTKMAFFIGLIGAFGGSLLQGLVLAPVLSRTSVDPGRPRGPSPARDRGAGRDRHLVPDDPVLPDGQRGRPQRHTIPYGDTLSPDRIWQYLTASAQPGHPHPPAWRRPCSTACGQWPRFCS